MAIASTKAAYEAYKRAAEAKDEQALLELYADDAEFMDYNRRTPPASPERVQGKEAIRSRIDMVPKHITHRIGDPVLDESRMAFSEWCEYPTGEKVFGLHICELRGGKIAKEVITEAWDE